MEDKLQVAQLHDALEGIQHVLLVKTRMIQFENANIQGQKSSTRSQTIINWAHERARGFAQKYCVAREWKLLLSGPGKWEQTLRPLADGDIQAYTDPGCLWRGPGHPGTMEDDTAAPLQVPLEGRESRELEGVEEEGLNMEMDEGSDKEPGMEQEGISLITEARNRCTGATHKEISWIWTTRSIASKLNDDDPLCSEWAKNRAWANCASEEVLLLCEEMGRALHILKWKGRWWRDHVSAWPAPDKELAEGLKAYALEQASLQEGMALSFRQAFHTPIEDGIAELHHQLAAIASSSTTPNPEPSEDDEEEYEDDDGQEIHSPDKEEGKG
ncbi:hypothetical protein DXG01_006715 [Tephrocybe rancida]|nr:hypothetical protein DXG01_006715 [Tephrocybe rancida]